MKTFSSHPGLLECGFLALSSLVFACCTQSTTPSTDVGNDIVLRSEIDNSTMLQPKFGGSDLAGIDSVHVNYAAFVAGNLMVRSDTSDAESDPNLAEGFIRPEQFILAFDATSTQYIGEHTTFTGVYRSARFDIHQVHGSVDSLAAALGPYYLSVLGGTASTLTPSTIRIQGVLWKGGVEIPFGYATSTTGSGRIVFSSPITTTGNGGAIQVSVKFVTASAFTDPSGKLLDPRDPKNGAVIDANLKTAVRGDVVLPPN